MSTLKYKVILLGNYNSGKTTLFNKIKKGKDPFQDNIKSIGTDQISLNLNLDVGKNGVNTKQSFEVNIVETAGKKEFIKLTKNYFHGSDGFLLTYDITDKTSFEDIEMWVNSIKEEKTGCTDSKYAIILIGFTSNVGVENNERVVTEEEGYEKCEKLNLIWGGEHDIKNMIYDDVKKLIDAYIKEIYDVFDGKTTESINKIIKLGQVKKEKSSCVSKKSK